MTTPITMTLINSIADDPVKDGPTHLQDHRIIARALKGYIPYVIAHAEVIPNLAPLASPVFTGTAVVPAMRFGVSAAVGQVLTASTVSGGVQWADPAVASVAGRRGAVTLSVSDVSGAAPIDSPVFHDSIATPSLTVSGGDDAPRPGQVLTALDEGGEAVWEDRIPVHATLPPADADSRGSVVLLEGDDGEADTLNVCLRQASGQYRWHQIQVGSSIG